MSCFGQSPVVEVPWVPSCWLESRIQHERMSFCDLQESVLPFFTHNEKRQKPSTVGHAAAYPQEAQLPSLGDGFGFFVETSLLNKHHGASLAASSSSSRSISFALDFIVNYILDSPPGKVPHGH